MGSTFHLPCLGFSLAFKIFQIIQIKYVISFQYHVPQTHSLVSEHHSRIPKCNVLLYQSILMTEVGMWVVKMFRSHNCSISKSKTGYDLFGLKPLPCASRYLFLALRASLVLLKSRSQNRVQICRLHSLYSPFV